MVISRGFLTLQIDFNNRLLFLCFQTLGCFQTKFFGLLLSENQSFYTLKTAYSKKSFPQLVFQLSQFAHEYSRKKAKLSS